MLSLDHPRVGQAPGFKLHSKQVHFISPEIYVLSGWRCWHLNLEQWIKSFHILVRPRVFSIMQTRLC